MPVKAKFRCNYVTQHDGYGHGEQREVKLTPVMADGQANDSWSKATPSGELKMLITNPAAFEQFKPGQEYFIEITPANH